MPFGRRNTKRKDKSNPETIYSTKILSEFSPSFIVFLHKQISSNEIGNVNAQRNRFEKSASSPSFHGREGIQSYEIY